MADVETRNLILQGRRTSLRLEEPIWEAIEDIALREGETVNEICERISATKGDRSLASSVRVFALNYYREAMRAFWQSTDHGEQQPAIETGGTRPGYDPAGRRRR